jgi:amino acid transporter
MTKLSRHTDEPLGTIIDAGLLSMVPLLFLNRIPVLIAAVTALIIIPYILVLASLLVRRLQGWPHAESQFNLGRWGLPITVAGLIWTVVILWDAAWPREVTNPKLGPLPVIEDLAIGVIVVGLVWWFARLRNKEPAKEPVPAASGPG